MKGNVAKTGRSFKNRVDYILKDDHDFICSNMSADKNNVSDLTDEFKAVSSFRPDIKKPVFHAFLSLPKNEHLTDEKWQEIAKDYLKEMSIDIEKHQYICVRHKDTDQDHIHIVANRIGLDGSVWHGQHSAFNTIAACERLEIKHSLTITKSLQGQKSDVSAPTKNEIEQALRTGEKPARLVLQNALQAALVGKPDLSTFLERLQAVGIEPAFNVASTGNVAGVSFGIKNNEKNIFFKGSSLGKKFSWNTIKAKVKYDKNRDDELIRRFAARKTDDENSIGRSPIEPNINDDRTIIRIDDDPFGVSQHSIKSDTTDTNKSEQLIRSNHNSFKLSEKYNRPTSNKVRRTTQKTAQILNRVKKQYNKESIKPYNQGSFNIWRDKSDSGSISRILDHAETANAATHQFRLKGRRSFNSRATKIEEIREKLGIQKPVIQPKKIVKEEIKKKPLGLSMNENRFKSKLKEALKKEKQKNGTTLLQQEDDQHLKSLGFKPR
ncbi:relaxase [Escherichia coli]|uniref:Relaxase n=1 Tax=Escherichia coli TaxID=562 RepID=A0A8T9CZP7_ECOLX|nr:MULTISPECIES: relaxase/mobilization nuclease domain-containing protein [Enterobacteriaceae]HDS7522655.1 relaxase/mobilization nuclease domain-containing protein [Klebsiella pneumoniae subsp. pneumoniae]KAA5738514.1 relaxase/mobilization nuclease domain-containing protein [Klebsiella pneumoniae]KAA5768418.1 relaxase/mobilization nuclease domain-containing protein [Klebsiella pneumoniae]TXU37705.1 relaxase [Escherichia coli]HBR2818694.1 relaxase/mobilization nuclease domain-containing protein